MANYCYNSVTFYGDEEKIKKLFEKVQYALSKEFGDIVQTQFSVSSDPCWLGLLALEFGANINGYVFSEEEKMLKKTSDTGLNCRGSLTRVGLLSPEILELTSNSAWHPHIELWNMIAEQSDVNFELWAEEPGCGIFINTDTDGIFYPVRYRIYRDEYDDEYFPSLESFLNAFNGYTGENARSFEEAEGIAYNMDGFGVNEFKAE